jgi:hypothetical protein
LLKCSALDTTRTSFIENIKKIYNTNFESLSDKDKLFRVLSSGDNIILDNLCKLVDERKKNV